jgi:hypothetical protein
MTSPTSTETEAELEEIGQTASGYTIWCKPNKAGGHTYWSDSIGGGVIIWDTCLASEEELLFCMNHERSAEALGRRKSQ